MLLLTLMTFLLTSPLNTFISTLSTVESSIGKPAPPVVFINLRDNTIHNTSEFHGRVIILNYWETGSIDCQQEMQDLKELEISDPDRIRVISISHDPVDSVRNYIQRHPVPLFTGICPGDQWIDPGNHLPFNVLIDKSGIIRGYFYGKDNFIQLKDACLKYVEGSP